MEGGGFEPPKAAPTDLQSAPFDRSGTPPKFNKKQEAAHYDSIKKKVNTQIHAVRIIA